MIPSPISIIDVGCGNGVILVKLMEHGYTRLTGVDYSKTALELAEIYSKEEHPENNISWQV
jgi:16S rRNA G1207 methylase RsmC